MIIDAHGHADEYELFNWIDPPETVISLMDKAGIDITLITTYGDAPGYQRALSILKEYIDRYPDRLIGFVRIDPRGGNEALTVIEQASETEGIMGVKLHPVTNLLKPYNPFCLNVMKKAGELHMPVFIHCCDRVAAQPWQIGLAAQKCPDTTIICHMGGYFHGEEVLRMAKECPNIVLDTSSMPYPSLISEAIDMIGSSRIVFASDNPAGDPISDLFKITNLHLPKEQEEQILYRNISTILKLKSIRGTAL